MQVFPGVCITVQLPPHVARQSVCTENQLVACSVLGPPTGSCFAQTSDKAVLEEFEEPADAEAAITEVVSRAVSPASEIGGDARLILPDERRIKSEVADHDGLVSGRPLPLQLPYQHATAIAAT